MTGAEDSPRSYDLALDGPAFRTQRERLLKLTDALHRGKRPHLVPADQELLEGLVNLTDAIADQAAGRHGIDCLLPVSEETEAGDAEARAQPQDRLVNDLGLTDEDLDEIVHDIASEVASDINNGGVSSQIEYLVAQHGKEEAERALRLLASQKGETS